MRHIGFLCVKLASVIAVSLFVAACGGGGEEAPAAEDAGIEVRDQPLAIAAPSAGRWSALRTLPLVPVAAANLPNGRVLMWSAEEKFSFGAEVGRTYSLIYDSVLNSVSERTVTSTGHNMFCPGTTLLSDGRLLVNGGISSHRTSLYDPATDSWSTGAAMNIPRGYQANTLLQDGSVLTLGGSWSGGVGNKHGEVWTQAGGWRRLSGVPVNPFLSPDPSRDFGGDSHFWMLPAGNGKVFHAGPGVAMHWIDTRGNGRVINAGVRGDDHFSVSGSTVMFDAGKILKTGGGPGYEAVQANANSYVIDVTGGVSVRKLNPMAYRRAFHNSVVLPTGKVMIIGGQTYAVGFSDNNSVLAPELWDPVTETFTALAPIAAPRNYHSLALLLPDARVLSAGGGLCGAGCAANHPDLQIYSPYYLFNADGSAASRPVIQTAPTSARYGQKLTVTTDRAVSSFAIVRTSAVTHTVNNDQRRIALVSRSTGTNRYEIDMPMHPGWALPGDWMLFAMTAEGVPSVSKTVRIGAAGAPVLQPIDDAAGMTGVAASLQPAVTWPAGQGGSFGAAGLPRGMAIDAGSGLISGTPTLAGNYPVTVTATSNGVTVATDFVWRVDSATALQAGLKGHYFIGTALSGSPLRESFEAIDFNWGTGAPAAGLPSDNFSVRWVGWLQPSISGTHVLQTLSDDGVRVWVNDRLVIDNWTAHSATLDRTEALTFTAGVRVPIRVEYFEAGVDAQIALRWRTPGSLSFVPVPKAQLLASAEQPNRAPTIAAPTLPPTYRNLAQTLVMSASDPDGDLLSFSASGLPPGMTIQAATGVISGTPTAAGTFDVTIGVADGRGGTAVTRFNWPVLEASPVLQPVAIAPATSGRTVNYTASTSGGGTYTWTWNFGDGTPTTAPSTSPNASHLFAAPGVYTVTVTAATSDGRSSTQTLWQAVQGTAGEQGKSSTPILVEPRSGASPRIWSVNPDNDSVAVIDGQTHTRIAEITVGADPRTIARAADGRLWVTNRRGASLSVISPTTLAVVQTVALPRASGPWGVVAGSDGSIYVALEAAGTVQRLSSAGAVLASSAVGPSVRHLALDGAGTRLLATRFVTPPLPGEETATVQTSVGGAARGGELLVFTAATLALQKTTVLTVSTRADSTAQGRGVPNYLGAPAIAPGGAGAWVPSKQDNIQRGMLRDGRPLDFQNTVRAVTSLVDLGTLAEVPAARIDHDNSGVASAAVFHPGGAYLFVALETSRHVAVVDATGRRELFRVDVGRAPQGLALSPDGQRLYVHQFMDRDVGVYDLTRLLNFGEAGLPQIATVLSRATERLDATVLRGKQLFYDARDPRLARDAYLSCASCHNDGGDDGRTWDFTGFGEGLRNTIALRGRAGAQGRLHWSANFDEVQDFEGQIRTLAQGTGLMTAAQFGTGTRSQPLGDAKAGVSIDLDALAAYVASLKTFDPSPYRNANGTLTAAASAGRDVFAFQCTSCHGGSQFTASPWANPFDIGTLKASSGKRLGGLLSGIDPPTLRDAWATAPYLHDGSARTLEDAVRAHNSLSLSDTDLANVAAFVRQIGSEEATVQIPIGNAVRSTVFGDLGGISFRDPAAADQWITGVTVSAGSWVDAIQAHASPISLARHGGAGGADASFTLRSGETIVRVFGRTGANPVTPAISQISFVTNQGRVFGPYGAGLGQDPTAPFDISLPPGGRVVGFAGRAGTYLNAIGLVYIVDQPVQAVPKTDIVGAAGGMAFLDPVVSGQRLTGVAVSSGSWIDAIQGLAAPSDLPRRGGAGGGEQRFVLESDEYLVRVFGLQGSNPVTPALAQISFVSNKGRIYGPYGEGLGQDPTTPFDIIVPAGGRIVGFVGRAGTYLNALGVQYVLDGTAPAVTASPLFGSTVGTAFSDPVVVGQALTGIAIRSGSWIDSIQALSAPADLPEHGGGTGAPAEFKLTAGEYVVRLYGYTGANTLYPAVAQVSFVTSTGRVFGPYGAGLGQDPLTPFDFTVPAGQRVVGLAGRAGAYLHAIGVLYAP